jgi:hypothetical protein
VAKYFFVKNRDILLKNSGKSETLYKIQNLTEISMKKIRDKEQNFQTFTGTASKNRDCPGKK